MKLKQEDRDLLNEFFCSQSEWMGNNSLRDCKNLKELKKRFLEFIESRNCQDNIACKLFVLTLEHQILNCEEEELIQLYRGDKKTKLTYFSATRQIDNLEISAWKKEAECDMTLVVSASAMQGLDNAIKEKTRQNRVGKVSEEYRVGKVSKE